MALHAGAVTASLEMEKKNFENGLKSALKDFREFKKQIQKESRQIKEEIENATKPNQGNNINVRGTQTTSTTQQQSKELKVLKDIQESITLIQKDVREIKVNNKRILTALSSSPSNTSNTPNQIATRTNQNENIRKIIQDSTQIKKLTRESKNSLKEINQTVKTINLKIRDKNKDKNTEKVQMLTSITKRVRNIESVLRTTKNTLNKLKEDQDRQNRRNANASSSGNNQINITSNDNILKSIERHTRKTDSSTDQILKQVKKIVREMQRGNREQQQQTEAMQETANNTGSNAGGGEGGFSLLGAAGTVLPAVGLAMSASGKEDILSQFQIQTGASQEEMKEFEQNIDNVAKKGVGNFEEVALAMSIIKRETNLTGEELELATSKALMFQQKMDWDVKESTRAIGSLMKNYNMSYEDATDLILKTAQVAGDEADDLLDTFWEYAPQMKEMGIDPKQFANYLAAGSQAGVYNFDKVADMLKETQLRITGGGKSTVETLQALGFNYEQVLKNINAGGEVAKKQYDEIFKKLSQVEDQSLRKMYAFEIAGAPGEDVGMALFDEMSKGKDLIGEYAGTSHKALERFEEDFSTQWQGLINELIIMVQPLGMEIIQVMKDLIPVVKPIIEQLTEVLKNPAFAEFLATIIIIISAIGGILVPLGAFIGSLSVLIPIAKGVVGVISAIAGVLSGPVGAAILAVIGLLVGFYFAMKTNFLGIRDNFFALVEFITSTFDNFVEFVKNFSELWKKDPIEAIKYFVTSFIGFVKSWWQFIWDTGLAFTGFVGLLFIYIKNNWDKIANFFSEFGLKIKEIFTNILADAGNFLSGLVVKIHEKLTEAWQTVLNFGSRLFEAGKNLMQNLINGIKTLINKPKEMIGDALNNIPGVGNLVGNAKSKVSGFFDGVSNKLESGLNFGKGIFGINNDNSQQVSSNSIGTLNVNVDGGNPDNIIRTVEDYLYDAERRRSF